MMEVLLRRHGDDGGATVDARRLWRCYCGGTAVMRCYCGGTAVMEVILRRHGGDGGATAEARR